MSFYNQEYLKWKKWSANFGRLKKANAAYFSSEISRTKNKFNKGAKVLEIGFGNGDFLKYATEKNWDVCGTEVNNLLVKTASKNGYTVFHTDNLSKFSDNIFDLVVAFDVLEHIPQDALLEIISEVNRILKPNAFFMSRFPNGDSPFGLMIQNGDITHITTIGSQKARYFASTANMEIIFIGAEALPIFGVNLLQFFHRIFAIPIKKIINLTINLIFCPRGNVEFCSPNLIMICRAKKGSNNIV